jgi:tetratricopeptide (TPR) repeat protein
VIEIDGLPLPIVDPAALGEAPAPILLLPRGTHAVLFRAHESAIPVTIQSDFVSEYRAMRDFFGVGGSVRSEELMSRSARTMDVHGAPFLLNFMGASHAAADRWAVAERKFRRALAVNPTFSPAHLNLAECLFRRNELEEAAREAQLAAIFNVQNLYGLAVGITEMRRKLGLPIAEAGSVDARQLRYVSSEPLSEEDGRMTALLEGISKYAVEEAERGKILNNLAVHLADRGRPELALHHFREALAVFKLAGPGRFELARRVFSNMSHVCRKAGFQEADEYDQMQHLVSP